MKMVKPDLSIALIFPLIASLACNALIPAAATRTAAPSPLPPTAIPLSSRLTLTSVPFEETSQSPVYTMRAQIPVLTGSDDPRLPAFNQVLNNLVAGEVNIFRKNFLELPVTPYSTGSSFDEEYTLLWQRAETWSFKFDFSFYSDGAAHPGHYSRTLNYDLGQARQLALADLFLPNSDYLGAISKYCFAELAKNPGFDPVFQQGAAPTLENYRDWNITADGLLITFDEYQVMPYASGPQTVTVPYAELAIIINLQGPLGDFTP
jgi:hypothetical protein